MLTTIYRARQEARKFPTSQIMTLTPESLPFITIFFCSMFRIRLSRPSACTLVEEKKSLSGANISHQEGGFVLGVCVSRVFLPDSDRDMPPADMSPFELTTTPITMKRDNANLCHSSSVPSPVARERLRTCRRSLPRPAVPRLTKRSIPSLFFSVV